MILATEKYVCHTNVLKSLTTNREECKVYLFGKGYIAFPLSADGHPNNHVTYPRSLESIVKSLWIFITKNKHRIFCPLLFIIMAIINQKVSWLAKGWSLILAEPTRTRLNQAEPTRTHRNPNPPRDILYSELKWEDNWAETWLRQMKTSRQVFLGIMAL